MRKFLETQKKYIYTSKYINIETRVQNLQMLFTCDLFYFTLFISQF